MFRKKVFSVLMAVVCTSFVLGGCSSTAAPQSGTGQASSSGPSTTNVDANQTSQSANVIEIDFWSALSGKNGEAVQTIVDGFNASQSNIKVNVIVQGDYYENAAKIQAALISNTQPVLTMMEVSQVGDFGLKNALADLGGYFSADEVSMYVEGLMKNSYVNDKLVAIPFNRSTPILYLNKDMLRAKGLDENGPKNWEELRSFANSISDPANGVYGMEVPIDIWFYEAGVFQQGGHIINSEGKADFNNEAGWAVAQLWQDMIKEGSMKAPVGQDYNAWDAATSDFLTQKVAMIQVSTGSLSTLLEGSQGQFEMGTAFLPAGKQYGTPTGGACLAVLDKATEEQKAAAAEFIRYATNAENAAIFSKTTGYMPVNKQAVESPLIQELYTQFPQYKIAYEQLQYAQNRPPVAGWREISIIIQEELKAAMSDTSVPVQTAVEKAQKQVEDLLAK